MIPADFQAALARFQCQSSIEGEGPFSSVSPPAEWPIITAAQRLLQATKQEMKRAPEFSASCSRTCQWCAPVPMVFDVRMIRVKELTFWHEELVSNWLAHKISSSC